MFSLDVYNGAEPATYDEGGEYENTGPFITFADFAQGVTQGAYGPDEDTRWVYIDELGNLAEMPTHNAQGKMNMFPATMICVAYYDK